MIYLASPYSHPDADVREQRFQAACHAAAGLVASGELVVCPVAHSHAIAVHGRLPTEWQFWARFDRRLVAACDQVVVLTLQGWRESAGVQARSIKKVNPQSMIHLTEKPVELAMRAMQYSSRPGENVLDLFGGL